MAINFMTIDVKGLWHTGGRIDRNDETIGK